MRSTQKVILLVHYVCYIISYVILCHTPYVPYSDGHVVMWDVDAINQDKHETKL